MVNHATVRPSSTAAWPSASQKCDLPVPDGPQIHKVSLFLIHSRVFSASCVGRGIDEAASSQSPNVLPAGKPARLRRVRRLVASRPRSSRPHSLNDDHEGRASPGAAALILSRPQTSRIRRIRIRRFTGKLRRIRYHVALHSNSMLANLPII
jgi:hypothetical protein